MGRIVSSTECDELERVIRKRNAVCSYRLLEALRLNHGDEGDEPEPEPREEPEPEPQPEPAPEPLTPSTVTELPIVMISRNKVEQIKRIICKRYGISKAEIESNTRKAKVVRPRQIGMFIARKYTTHSFPEIGRRFGGRDHTTILYACAKIEKLAAADASLASQIAEIRAEIPA